MNAGTITFRDRFKEMPGGHFDYALTTSTAEPLNLLHLIYTQKAEEKRTENLSQGTQCLTWHHQDSNFKGFALLLQHLNHSVTDADSTE